MYTREARIREAFLQVDRRLRLTVELHGRARLLTFATPPIDILAAPIEERAIDLDRGSEDSKALFMAQVFIGFVQDDYRHGRIADDVEALPEGWASDTEMSSCPFGMRFIRP